MRIIFAGTPEVALPSLDKLLKNDEFELVAIITKYNKSKKISPVEKFALENKIPIMAPKDPNSKEFIDELKLLKPDCCAVVAYGNLLKQELIDIPKFGWVNLHFSLLPMWRGAAPVQSTILNGDDFAGVTTFIIQKGLDDGPILGQSTIKLNKTETASFLLEKLSIVGAELLEATFIAIKSRTINPIPQTSENISFSNKITRENSRINWNDSSFRIERKIRSLSLVPGAWTTFNKNIMKVFFSELPTDSEMEDLKSFYFDLNPGELFKTKRNLYVRTGDSFLNIKSIQPEGKKILKAIDWSRGVKIDNEFKWI